MVHFCLWIIALPMVIFCKEGFLTHNKTNKVCEDCIRDYDGKTALMSAIENGASLATIQCYIEKGANVNAVCSEFLRCHKPVLRYALDRGVDSESVEIIKALLAAKADPNQATYNRVRDQNLYGFMSLLSYAVIYSSPEIVRLFVQQGADVNLKMEDEFGSQKSALMYAEELGKDEVVALLTMNTN